MSVISQSEPFASRQLTCPANTLVQAATSPLVMLPSKASSTGAKMVNPLLPPEPNPVKVLSVLVLLSAAA